MVKWSLLAAACVHAAAMSSCGVARAGTPAEDYAACDADRSGALNPAEFRCFIGRAAQAGRARAVMVRDNNAYDRAFTRLDRDRNGQLSRPELQIG
ncbi:MAG: hypothetical protein Q8S03_05460 [Brevundimonas sp.]|uniref:hypothetical protein n=1 Tax=Brevundimonas sp. TaxID=1871086 RepID=UPI002735C7D9|nr:hypothetical protein [Brevundimonas sp.]MDP3404117.1 hypothetical protein [Brevundimonas sp.]